MLITPEQKRGLNADICDNQTDQRHVGNSHGLFETKDTLDNGNNLKENDHSGRDATLSSNELHDKCTSSPSSTSLSLNDIKNCNTLKSYPQRSLQRLRGKFPPHIDLQIPKRSSPSSPRRALFINDDVTDDCTQPLCSPTSASPTRTSPVVTPGTDNDKHELFSGRLYLIRHTGKGSPSQSPSSPSRAPLKYFPFPMSSTLASSPTSSPPLPSSPKLGAKRKMPVYMRVYKCNVEHFALVSRDSSYTSKHIYLNLRHCRVMPGNCLGRFVVAGHCDSGTLMEFETTDLSSLEKWLDALQIGTPPGSPIRQANATGGSSGGGGGSSSNGSSPPIPKSPALPTLAETDEEDGLV